LNRVAYWFCRWLLVLSASSFAHCQAVYDPFPCTPTLREYEVKGPVRTLLLDIPLRWSEQDRKMVSASDGIELLEFNRRGYLVKHSLGSIEGGHPNTYPYQVYVLDEKDLLVQYEGDAVESGGPAFLVRYEYSRANNAIEIKEAKVEVFGGRGTIYRTYREEFANGTRRLLVYNHSSTTIPPVLLERVDVYEGGQLASATVYSNGDPLEEQLYADGRIVRTTSVKKYATAIAEEVWTYADGSPGPSSKTTTWGDGSRALYEYKYAIDDRGNWATREEYLVEGGSRKLMTTQTRIITYY
jgi:hypothetical protein